MNYETIGIIKDGTILKGKGTKQSVVIHAEIQVPKSQLWYCPRCGECFIKLVVLNSYSRYIALANECYECTKNELILAITRLTLPGSILMEGYNTIEELPEGALRQELLIELHAMRLLIDNGVL